MNRCIRRRIRGVPEADRRRPADRGCGRALSRLTARRAAKPQACERLAELLAAYREDDINFETLTAFAITDDHERQDASFATWESGMFTPTIVFVSP